MQRYVQLVRSNILRLVVLLTLSCGWLQMHGQAEQDTIQFDTIREVKKGSIFKGRPGRSMLFSLVLPGAGQIYNKSYWRAPIVWAAVGGVGFLLIKNTNEYNCARSAYIAKVDGLTWVPPKNCPNKLKDRLELPGTSAATTRVIRDNANQNRQLSIIGFSLVWLANGIDAFVDAHLKDFNVDGDLSINFSTRLDNDPYAPMRIGMFLSLK